ncbi:MAG: hypothetical protein LLG97_19380 [Deltaproteobacteria bacterium]|nr:hypothetical protein [Deltaproteobacteria bacterium]
MDMRCTFQARKDMPARAPAIVQRRLDSAIHEATMLLVGEVKRIIWEEKRLGVGGVEAGLYKDIESEVLDQGTPLVKGIVFTGRAYGIVIEKGRRPGKAWPPQGVLLPWIQLKLGLSGEQAKDVEFLIRRKIGKLGFPGIHMFERAFNQNRPKIQKMFEKAGYDIVDKVSEGGA